MAGHTEGKKHPFISTDVQYIEVSPTSHAHKKIKDAIKVMLRHRTGDYKFTVLVSSSSEKENIK